MYYKPRRKQRVRLTEGQLARLVRRCVNEALDSDAYAASAAADKASRSNAIQTSVELTPEQVDALQDIVYAATLGQEDRKANATTPAAPAEEPMVESWHRRARRNYRRW